VLAGCSGREAAPVRAAGVKSAPGAQCSLAGREGELVPLSRSGGTVTLANAAERTLAFVADEDAERLSVVDLDAGTELAALELGTQPGAVLVAPGGGVAVTLPRRAQLQLLTFDGKSLAKGCAITTAAEPVALALSPDQRTLFVVSAWGHALGAYSAATLGELYRLDLPRDPRGLALSDDGARAYVAHGVGSTLSSVDLAARSVRRVSLDAPISPLMLEQARAFRESVAETLRVSDAALQAELKQSFEAQLKSLLLPERTGNHGFALVLSSQGGGRLLLPQVEVDSGRSEQRSAGYGSGNQSSVAPNVAVIDPSSLELDTHSIPQIPAWREASVIARDGCRLPRAAALDEAAGTLLVTCLGTDVLVGYDAAAPSPADAESLRVPVASGPTGVAVDAAARRAVVWSQFERVLNLVPLPSPGAPLTRAEPNVRRIALAPSGSELSERVALGRRLFHAVDDPRIARDGRACASCHIGGRDDGLVWSTPRGPRRTKLLAGSVAGTAPYAWDGAAATLHDQIEGTLERLDGEGGLRPLEIEALAAYVASLPAPPRETAEAEASARGAALFASAETGCSTCHTGKVTSDGARHAVSSETSVDATTRFDTPSLAFLSGRAPYFHDGRYATLAELLAAKGDKMGRTSQLSAADLAALEAFLRTL
jgi:mono/diheme cytochrome c family protein/DNA-binding beta-propeller fold protein YncE